MSKLIISFFLLFSITIGAAQIHDDTQVLDGICIENTQLNSSLIQAHYRDADPPNNIYCIGGCSSGMCCGTFPVLQTLN